jgi:hypothetical protein
VFGGGKGGGDDRRRAEEKEVRAGWRSPPTPISAGRRRHVAALTPYPVPGANLSPREPLSRRGRGLHWQLVLGRAKAATEPPPRRSAPTLAGVAAQITGPGRGNAPPAPASASAARCAGTGAPGGRGATTGASEEGSPRGRGRRPPPAWHFLGRNPTNPKFARYQFCFVLFSGRKKKKANLF